MADFPTDGGDEDAWGAKLIAFFKTDFNMSGATGGTLAEVCYENKIVCYENNLLIYVEN